MDEPVEKYYGPPKPPFKVICIQKDCEIEKQFPVKEHDIEEMYTRQVRKYGG